MNSSEHVGQESEAERAFRSFSRVKETIPSGFRFVRIVACNGAGNLSVETMPDLAGFKFVQQGVCKSRRTRNARAHAT